MSLVFTVVTASIKSLTRILCNVDDGELVNVPENGPLIITSNHISFLEVPLLYTHLQPRNITGFAKAETWENPALAFLFDLWDAIPLQRGEADAKAFRRALEALQQGKILAVAPEGTRSRHGKLQRGLPGIVMLAFHSHAPILPLVYYGGEKLRSNLNKLKRTDFHIKVGKIFTLAFPDHKPDRDVRAAIVDEIMYQLAVLLPEEYRGYYSDLSRMSTNYLNFA
ncbi:MAG: lysophospholipid acyltransferase family protein [Acidobacteriaceae bacterium]